MMSLSFYIFLGLFLFSGQINSAPSYENHEGIEIVLNTIFGQVTSLYKQIQLTILQLSNVAEMGLRKIEEDFMKAAINISDLINDFGSSAKVCIKKYWKTLENAKIQLKTNIEQCSQNVKKDGSRVTDNLQKQQKQIEKSSKQFYDTINECLEFSSNNIPECIFYKMGELKTIANDVTGTTENTLKQATEFTSRISKQGNDCIRNALESFDRIQNDISSKIRECVKTSWMDYY